MVDRPLVAAQHGVGLESPAAAGAADERLAGRIGLGDRPEQLNHALPAPGKGLQDVVGMAESNLEVASDLLASPADAASGEQDC